MKNKIITKYHLAKWKKVINIFILLFCMETYGLRLDVDLTGLSYHIGANSSNPAYSEAPRGLDKNGAFVFNPGAGLGIDFRKTSRDPFWHGVSPIVKFVYLLDCNDYGWQMLAVGGRYRYMISRNWSFDFNLAISAVRSINWPQPMFRVIQSVDSSGNVSTTEVDTGEKTSATVSIAINPYYSLGINYHYRKITIGFISSLIPENESAGDSISGFNILFSSLYFSFPIGSK